MSYTIRNTGDTVLAAGQSVTVAGPFDLGTVAADEVQEAPPLLPGETRKVSVPIDDVAPLGSLVASVRAVPLYTDAAGSTGPPDAVDAIGTGWAIPWAVVLMACGLIAVGAIGLTRRGRSLSSRIATHADDRRTGDAGA